jgi:hypothetical protein
MAVLIIIKKTTGRNDSPVEVEVFLPSYLFPLHVVQMMHDRAA